VTGRGARLSLAWVRVYTGGADQWAGARRAAEVASDIWEHEYHGLAEGRSRIAVEAEILSRCLRGAPADLSWRFQHRSTGGSALMQTITRNTLAIVAVLLAAWFFVLGVTRNFGEDSISVWWILALIASGVAVLTGLCLMQRSPRAGCALLTIGALPLGAVTAWAIFPPVLALAAVTLAIVRARAQTHRLGQLEVA
jgi:hypothetical protein